MNRANCAEGDLNCFWGPNGDDNVNSAYMTLNYVATSEWQYAVDDAEKRLTQRLAYNQEKYDDWNDWNDGMIWFDTAPCMSGPWVGDANAISVSPQSAGFRIAGDETVE